MRKGKAKKAQVYFESYNVMETVKYSTNESFAKQLIDMCQTEYREEETVQILTNKDSVCVEVEDLPQLLTLKGGTLC